MAATNKCLAQNNKSSDRGKATKKGESRSPRRVSWPFHRKGIYPERQRLRLARPNTSSSKHKKAPTMKFVPPDTSLKDYKERRGSFLKELIASTPNVSVRAKEFRRWIDENSPYSDNDQA